MTGQDIIDYIKNNKLETSKFMHWRDNEIESEGFDTDNHILYYCLRIEDESHELTPTIECFCRDDKGKFSFGSKELTPEEALKMRGIG